MLCRPFIDLGPDLPSYWSESMLPEHTPAGRPIARGPRAATFHEVLTRVAARECLTPLNEHVLRYYTHPGVVFVPVHDAPATEWAPVWRECRSDEGRVGKGCVRTCRCRWSPHP